MTSGPAPTNTKSPSSQRLRIEYFDQNESFASQLPRLGTIEQELAFVDSAGPWYLVRLDAPVFYQEKGYSQLLLMSRWVGYSIAGQEKTSVFMLLVPDGVAPKPTQSHKLFSHVAWGVATLV
ncbi:MAG: hypothetical protein V4719_16215 [Planctomycetota bacterium]